MLCKYCKKTDHLIDDCQEIICKKCRIIGHPFWKCKNSQKDNKKVNKLIEKPSNRYITVKNNKFNKDKIKKSLDNSQHINEHLNENINDDHHQKNIFGLLSSINTESSIKENNILEKHTDNTSINESDDIINKEDSVHLFLKYKAMKWSEISSYE